MLNKNINCSFHYPPVYKQPYYLKKFKKVKCNEMEKYYKDAITLPIFPTLKMKEQNEIIKCVRKFFNKYDNKYYKKNN